MTTQRVAGETLTQAVSLVNASVAHQRRIRNLFTELEAREKEGDGDGNGEEDGANPVVQARARRDVSRVGPRTRLRHAGGVTAVPFTVVLCLSVFVWRCHARKLSSWHVNVVYAVVAVYFPVRFYFV